MCSSVPYYQIQLHNKLHDAGPGLASCLSVHIVLRCQLGFVPTYQIALGPICPQHYSAKQNALSVMGPAAWNGIPLEFSLLLKHFLTRPIINCFECRGVGITSE